MTKLTLKLIFMKKKKQEKQNEFKVSKNKTKKNILIIVKMI